MENEQGKDNLKIDANVVQAMLMPKPTKTDNLIKYATIGLLILSGGFSINYYLQYEKVERKIEAIEDSLKLNSAYQSSVKSELKLLQGIAQNNPDLQIEAEQIVRRVNEEAKKEMIKILEKKNNEEIY